MLNRHFLTTILSKRTLNRFKDEKIKRLIENFFSLSVLQVVNYILPLVTLPYLVRVLGAEKFGLVMFANAFIQYFIMLTDYGFILSATREISVHREDIKKVSEIFTSVMIIKMVLFLVSLIILFGIVFSFDKFRNDWQLYFLTSGMILGNILFPIWFFQGMERMKYITILNITAKTIFTVLIFVFIRNQGDYIYVPVFNSLGFITAGILSFWIVIKYFKIRLYLPKISRIYSYFKDSTQYFLSRVSVSVYTSSNTFVVGLFLGNTAAGYYSAAEKLFLALRMAYTPLNTTLYPYMCNTRNLRLYKKIFLLAFIVNLALCSSIFLSSGFIIGLLYGEGFQVSVKLLQMFSILGLIIVPSILLGYPLLAALGHPKYANMSVIVASVFHLIMLMLIIPIIKIYFVVIIAMITETVVLLIRVYGIRKHKLWRTR